jgi:hypothetical protein
MDGCSTGRPASIDHASRTTETSSTSVMAASRRHQRTVNDCFISALELLPA